MHIYKYIHTSLLSIRRGEQKHILTWRSTDVAPCCSTFCHCVMDWTLCAQLVPPALTHLLFTWEYTLPPVGDGCGAGYSDGQLKSHVMEMALGENKLIDLTFSKIKSDENLLISQYGEIHSPNSKRYYFKMQRVIV